jgi:colicin import membrane protein
VKLNQDGSLAADPAVMNPSSDALFRTVADSATRATRRCAPLKIPAQFAPYYQDWKDLVVNFDPREMS